MTHPPELSAFEYPKSSPEPLRSSWIRTLAASTLALGLAGLLAGCSLSGKGAAAGGPLSTPTSSIFFLSGDSSIALEIKPPSQRGTPTQSSLFLSGSGSSQTPTATAAPVSKNQLQTPTLSVFFAVASPQPTQEGTPHSPLPHGTPTISALFDKLPPTPTDPQRTVSATVRSDSSGQNPTPSAQPVIRSAAQLKPVAVFSDSLDPNWSLDNSWGMDWAPDSAVVSPSGAKTIRFTPTEDFGGLFFTVQKSASAPYLREKTFGITFLLNPGDSTLGPDELAVTVVGSNEYPYWLKGDTSVSSENKGQMFSETRLYYLAVNRSLPPNSWTQINVWLDKLIYDPLYLNVTGIYLKTDRGVRKTIHIADVSLMVTP